MSFLFGRISGDVGFRGHFKVFADFLRFLQFEAVNAGGLPDPVGLLLRRDGRLHLQLRHHPEEDGLQFEAEQIEREGRRMHVHLESVRLVGLRHRQHRNRAQQSGVYSDGI